MDINVRDSKFSTPLHWACYTRSEMALTYLLSMKPNLEAKDVQGFTALHIAVASVAKLGSTRNVKALLLRGADRDQQDLKGQTPIKMIPKDLSEGMHKELQSMLMEQSYCECMMLKVPLIPLRKNHKTQTLFMSLFIIVFLLNMFVILPTIEPFNLAFQITSGVTTVLVFLSFLFASLRNPGVLKKDEQRSFLELLRDINPVDLCPECEVIRSARSRHCAICNQCVERFDHHCPWINNCVGIKNHNYFLLFLLSIWFKIMFHLVVDIFGLVRILSDSSYDFLDHQDFCYYGLCEKNYVVYSSIGVCLLICCFYLFLSTLLLYTHIKNYMANRTTNERYSRKMKPQRKAQDETSITSSVMSLSDFDEDSVRQSMIDPDND